jgi:hypothetical protein
MDDNRQQATTSLANKVQSIESQQQPTDNLNMATRVAILAETSSFLSAAGSIAEAAGQLLAKFLVTSYEQKTMAGDQEMKPTDSNSTINKSEIGAHASEAAAAQDAVLGTSGDLQANRLQGHAVASEANAANNGATATATDAGALQVETKGLNMI